MTPTETAYFAFDFYSHIVDEKNDSSGRYRPASDVYSCCDADAKVNDSITVSDLKWALTKTHGNAFVRKLKRKYNWFEHLRIAHNSRKYRENNCSAWDEEEQPVLPFSTAFSRSDSNGSFSNDHCSSACASISISRSEELQLGSVRVGRGLNADASLTKLEFADQALNCPTLLEPIGALRSRIGNEVVGSIFWGQLHERALRAKCSRVYEEVFDRHHQRRLSRLDTQISQSKLFRSRTTSSNATSAVVSGGGGFSIIGQSRSSSIVIPLLTTTTTTESHGIAAAGDSTTITNNNSLDTPGGGLTSATIKTSSRTAITDEADTPREHSLSASLPMSMSVSTVTTTTAGHRRRRSSGLNSLNATSGANSNSGTRRRRSDPATTHNSHLSLFESPQRMHFDDRGFLVPDSRPPLTGHGYGHKHHHAVHAQLYSHHHQHQDQHQDQLQQRGVDGQTAEEVDQQQLLQDEDRPSVHLAPGEAEAHRRNTVDNSQLLTTASKLLTKGSVAYTTITDVEAFSMDGDSVKSNSSQLSAKSRARLRAVRHSLTPDFFGPNLEYQCEIRELKPAVSNAKRSSIEAAKAASVWNSQPAKENRRDQLHIY